MQAQKERTQRKNKDVACPRGVNYNRYVNSVGSWWPKRGERFAAYMWIGKGAGQVKHYHCAGPFCCRGYGIRQTGNHASTHVLAGDFAMALDLWYFEPAA